MRTNFHIKVDIICSSTGYGDVTPRTATGMWLTIVAGFMGISIMVVTLKTQGELINCFIHFVIKFVERKIMKRSSVKHLEGKTLIITFVMVWSLLLSCAAMEKKYHNWTLLEGRACISFLTVPLIRLLFPF